MCENRSNRNALRPFEIRSTATTVEVWLARRLPFEPKGGMRTARDSIRDALRRMQLPSRSWLHCEYVSTRNDFFDVENVLLYNVGTSSLVSISGAGLRIFRTRAQPPPAPGGDVYPHYHRYAFTPLPHGPNCAPSLVFDSPKLSSSTKPHVVWWAVAKGYATPQAEISGPFRLQIFTPRSEKQRNIANIVKPLVDGIVSALHRPAQIYGEAVRRLAARMEEPQDGVEHHLRHPAAAILPARTVVTPYRNFVKWNPADELCEDVAIIPAADTEQVRVWISPL